MTAVSTDVPSAIEARTIRKLRTRIVPFIFVLFLIAFIDRINIGFAALTMNKELDISSQQFGFLAGIFFIGYFTFELPSNLLLYRIGARVWMARILITWGVVAILTGFAQRVSHLYVLRFLLGMAEAGYFPGMVLYLTYWFRQRQLGYPLAWLCAANPVASIVGGPVSGLILDHVHWLGFSSWRWLLILQGIPALLGGVATCYLLPSRPTEAEFLTPEEKEWITTELKQEEHAKRTTQTTSSWQTLVDGRIWHLVAIWFTAMYGMYAMTFWMPQLLKSLSSHSSNTTVGIQVMIPYLAGLPAMILVSRRSDQLEERRYHAAIPIMVGAIAFLLLGIASTQSTFLSIVLWCLVAMGIYSSCGPFWSLPSEFLAGYSAAAGIAIVNSFGNLGGFAGPYVMGAISKRTGNFHGGLVFAGISLFMSAILLVMLRKKSGETEAIERSASVTMPAAEAD